MSAPSSSVVQSVLDRMIHGTVDDSSSKDFHQSSTWQGSRPGYYFGTSDRGTGYHPDHHSQGAPAAATTILGKKKRSVKIDEGNNELRLFTASLLDQAEQKASNVTIIELTPKGIQSASVALEKLFQKNALLRAQHAEDPSQYLESELALHDQLQALTSVAANVQLYRPMMDHPTFMDTLMELLGHENDDIASIVISLYLEWLDPTMLQDEPDLADVLGRLASRVLAAWDMIVSNFSRFQTSTNNGSMNITTTTGTTQDPTLQGIDNTLSLMENLLDLDLILPGGIQPLTEGAASAAAYMVQESKIASWLLEQVDSSEESSPEFQGRCMELLSLLAQREDVHTILNDWSKLPKFPSAAVISESPAEPPSKKPKQEKITTPATIDGIECMLQIIGKFRKTQPSNDTEIGLLENTCLALSSCISFSDNSLAAFLNGQGVELVIRCLKERVHSGATTLKLLDFVGNSKEHKQACERLVTAGGFKYLFPLFLGTRIPKPAPSYAATTTKAKREWLNQMEAQTVRIFYSLSRHLDDQSPEDAKERFVAKFAQDETKCDRLVELLLYYDEKARKAEFQFYRSNVEEVVEDEETILLAALEAKLQGGGDLFHRLGALAAYLSVESKRCHERILAQLKLQQSGISLVKDSLEEFLSLLEEGLPQRLQMESYLTRI